MVKYIEAVDQPPKTIEEARRKFGQGKYVARRAYAWFFGEEALQRQLKLKGISSE